MDLQIPQGPAGLLLSRDLIFTSKITGTARALGLVVTISGNKALTSALLAQWKPTAIFVDLAAGELVSPSSLKEYRTLVGDGTPFIAFGSHVDTEALQAARDAGCDPVMPRSKFSAELPDLLRSFLSEG